MTHKVSFTCRAILFDLDGTLLDSTARIDRLWRWWADRHGMDFARLNGKIHGRPAVESLRLIDPALPLAQEIEDLETEEIRDMHDVQLIPGALELLSRLNPAQWAIVTSGSPRVACARIHHVGLPLPRVLITADQVKRGKPAPDGYLLAARRLGVKAEDCVVIEDAPVGVAAGKAAGMCVVAVAFSHPAKELASADALVHALSQIDVQPLASGLAVTLRLRL